MSLNAGYIVLTVCLFFAVGDATSLAWNLFTSSPFSNSSSFHLQEYARQKLSTLRHLRNKLNDHGNIQFLQDSVGKPGMVNGSPSTTPSSKMSTEVPPSMIPLKREESFGNIFKSVDNILSFTTGPLRKMITSKQGIESLATMVMPKRDVLQKLLEIKGHLEPSFKRYLTDKYNGFLSSLVPYSENIGVPPFVLNSMKIPQDFDPRWQLIKSLLESQGGIEKFLHDMINGDFKFAKRPEVIESRTSGDETELISDQEPDASGQGYRKQQQFYLSSFKKRLMKPGGGTMRFMQQGAAAAAAARPAASSSSIDYDSLLDQSGQYGHVSYDMRVPEEMMGEPYLNGDGNMAMSEMDMSMSASGYGGRGHGGGHGHGGGQASYGGFLDPFTILGGLAFLTYLGLMLQNSLNRGGNGTAGRTFPDSSFLPPVVPINLKSPKVKNSMLARIGGNHQRYARSLNLTRTPKIANVTVEEVLNDVSKLWEEIGKLNNNKSSRSAMDLTCSRFRQCKIVWKMRFMNLEPVFASKLIASTDDLMFLNYVLQSKLGNLCDPYRSKNCEE